MSRAFSLIVSGVVLTAAYGLTQSGALFLLLGPAFIAAGVGHLVCTDYEIR